MKVMVDQLFLMKTVRLINLRFLYWIDITVKMKDVTMTLPGYEGSNTWPGKRNQNYTNKMKYVWLPELDQW